MMENLLSLPRDLLLKILLNLPLKSLLRFKSVSKSCLSLISDPHFVKSHYEQARRRIMLLRSTYPLSRSLLLDAPLHDDSSSMDINLSFSITAPFHHVQMIGSCRGFLLFCDWWGDSSKFYLWNPSTSDHREIPPAPIASTLYNLSPSLYGFGYDPSTDDYLVVLSSCKDDKAAEYEIQFEYFSVRANSWNTIEDAQLPYMNNFFGGRVGSLLNGAVHWLVYRNDMSMRVIFAFDFVQRSFSDILMPEDLVVNFGFPLDLWVYGGSLSLWALSTDATEIWVMKEYGVQSSWSKSIVLPWEDIPNQLFMPMCSTKSGDIFGVDGNATLLKCTANGELLEHRSFAHDEGNDLVYVDLRIAMYEESLFSLPDVNEQAQDEE